MLEYNLFGYEVEIDKNATTAWYTASNVWGCECGDCRNFLALAQKRAFPLPVLLPHHLVLQHFQGEAAHFS